VRSVIGDPHRTFNDDDAEVFMTRRRDAVHRTHNGGTDHVRVDFSILHRGLLVDDPCAACRLVV